MAYDVPDDALEVRVPVKAGPRVVGVTFVKKSAALVESVREPFLAPHAEGGAALAARRQRHDHRARSTPTGVERHAEPAAHLRVPAGQPPGRSRHARGRSSRRSRAAPTGGRSTDAQLKVLLDFYNDGRANGGFEAGIELALRRLLVSPEFLFRIEADPSSVAAGLGVSRRRSRARVAAVVLPVEQHSRRRAARRGRARAR